MPQRMLRKDIIIDPTHYCPFRCVSCVTARKLDQSNRMSIDLFKICLDKIKGFIDRIDLYGWGEPCYSPDLPILAELGNKAGLKMVVATNPAAPMLNNKLYVNHLLDNLFSIGISFDGYDKQSLGIYRVGSDWGMMMRSIENISNHDGACRKNMRILIFKYNDTKIDHYKSIANKFNLIANFKAPNINGKFILPMEEADIWLSSIPQYQRYRLVTDGSKYNGMSFRGMITQNIKDKCYVHKSPSVCEIGSLYIAPDGNVSACAQDLELKYTVGHIANDSYSSLVENYYRMYAEELYYKKAYMCREICLCKAVMKNIKQRRCR